MSEEIETVSAGRPVYTGRKPATILLTSVFGPYAQNDGFGSRAINPMELYHNQVTRVQGPFSLRMFHRSWGLMLIQKNISAPSTLLDFPTQERFIQELQKGDYDIVGISAIVANIGKVRRMCQLIRRYSPRSVIVVGGHVASIPRLENMLDADHIAKGEGISWFRHFLGENETAKIVHPDIVSGFGTRLFGFNMKDDPKDTAATVITSVGCPMGCNFCATSALFGGKGHSVTFYKNGEELYHLMSGFEERMGTSSFFIMDENFLLNRPRAMELLELMERNGKAWSLYCFSSANALRQYSMEELLRLGLSWLWMGLEGEDSQYAKLKGCDSVEFVGRLQELGVKILGSSIIGLENHTPENIDQVIARAIRHNTDFHQFMLYTPLPGTPLFQEQIKNGTMLDDVDLADIHGQYRFNFRHPHISAEQSEEFLLRAFQADYDVNGPSVFRVINTVWKGWKNFHNYGDSRVRRRLDYDSSTIRKYAYGALWAMEKYLKESNALVQEKIHALREQFAHDFGTLTKAVGMLTGPVILASIRREAMRLKNGFTVEPKTFTERYNWAGL
ncbi:MAG: cobalamin-dependent protein [bacterium]|nr:cobalamin-dependent protein [bacterium]